MTSASHHEWVGDIEETQGTKLNFPLLGDPDRKVAKLWPRQFTHIFQSEYFSDGLVANHETSIILENMVKPLSPKQAQERIAQGGVEVIDVRDPHEWIDGHVPHARLVPLAQFRQNPKAALQHDGVIFVCAAGVRSETAARLAAQSGFKEVYNLTGGTRAWIKAGFALDHEPAVSAAE